MFPCFKSLWNAAYCAFSFFIFLCNIWIKWINVFVNCFIIFFFPNILLISNSESSTHLGKHTSPFFKVLRAIDFYNVLDLKRTISEIILIEESYYIEFYIYNLLRKWSNLPIIFLLLSHKRVFSFEKENICIVQSQQWVNFYKYTCITLEICIFIIFYL